MIIDSHEHVILPVEKHIEMLNKAGVDKAVLFSTSTHVESAGNLEALEAEMNVLSQILSGAYGTQERINRIQGANKELYQTIQKKPDRFYGFGAVPLGLDLKQTIDWLNQIMIYGFKGIGEFTPGTEAQVQQLDTVFCALEETRIMPVWVHTFHPVTAKGIRILMDLCQKYPQVPVIFGHLGGSNWIEVIKFAKEHKNIYLDLSAAYTSIATRNALVELPEQCLYSSDAPYGEPYLYRQMLEFVSPDQKTTDLTLGGNIAALLQL